MKILYYSPHPELSTEASTGYGTHMREMVAAFRKKGCEVKTLVAGDMKLRRKQSKAVAKSGTKGIRGRLRAFKSWIPGLLWESLRDLWRMRFDRNMEAALAAAISDFEPDLVYERVAYLQNSGVEVSKRRGIQHVAEINAPYPEERAYFSGRSLLVGAARNSLRQIVIETNLIVSVSTALAAYLDEMAEGVKEKTLVLPNAIRHTEVVHTADQLEQLREELSLGDSLILGFVGSIFPYHGVDLLIEAFAKLPKAPRSKLLIVGDGASLPELKALALRLGVHGDVVFTGGVPHREVYLYIELMDICCMAKSNWYGSPVKIFEYGLLKKVVIAPDIAPLRDVLDEETALLVEPEAEAISDAMRSLLGDESLRLKLAEAWHRKVLMEHTWEQSAQKVLERCASL